MDIKSMTIADLQSFARRDDCLDKMVPSDLRVLISQVYRAGYFDCREDMKKATRNNLASTGR